MPVKYEGILKGNHLIRLEFFMGTNIIGLEFFMD